jgi:predicted DNA-binding transcriptional regulator AlpA
MDFADRQLLRPAEVIDLLGGSRSWLYDAAKAGRIPCVGLGGPDGPVRFRARELEAWIERSRIGPPGPRSPAQTGAATSDHPAPGQTLLTRMSRTDPTAVRPVRIVR